MSPDTYDGALLRRCARPRPDGRPAERCAALGCPERARFVPGHVLAGVETGTTLAELLAHVEGFRISLEEVTGVSFDADLPPDGVASVLRALRGKAYVEGATEQSVRYDEYGGHLVAEWLRFHNVDRAVLADWEATRASLGLRERRTVWSVILRVPRGTEARWVSVLERRPPFRWASLNEYVETHLHLLD